MKERQNWVRNRFLVNKFRSFCIFWYCLSMLFLRYCLSFHVMIFYIYLIYFNFRDIMLQIVLKQLKRKVRFSLVFFYGKYSTQPDEVAKQNADVFPSYLAPLSDEEKIYGRKTRTQAMIVDPPEASGQSRESKSSVSLWRQLTNVELKGACTTMLEKEIIIKTNISHRGKWTLRFLTRRARSSLR